MNTVFLEHSKKINNSILNTISENIFSLEIVKNFVIDNIQKRLFETGKDVNDKKLQTDFAKYQNQQYYSKNTQKIKRKKGQSISNVTLQDSGDFYNSWKLIASKTFYVIYANFNKKGNNIFNNFQDSYTTFESFQNAILSMNDNELDLFFQNLFIPNFKQNFLNYVQM